MLRFFLLLAAFPACGVNAAFNEELSLKLLPIARFWQQNTGGVSFLPLDGDNCYDWIILNDASKSVFAALAVSRMSRIVCFKFKHDETLTLHLLFFYCRIHTHRVCSTQSHLSALQVLYAPEARCQGYYGDLLRTLLHSLAPEIISVHTIWIIQWSANLVLLPPRICLDVNLVL